MVEGMKVETFDDGGTRREGFRVQPRQDFIFLIDYGQPDKTLGGLYVPDDKEEFWRYRQTAWRFGEIIAVGPGRRKGDKRIPMPDLKVGDKIIFSRKFGTRLAKWRFGFESIHYPEAGSLNVRVLDMTKVAGVVNDFEPWWNLSDSQLNPDGTMTG